MEHQHSTVAGKLIITRHTESEWNKLNIWTGSRDVHITPHGIYVAECIGAALKDIRIDSVFISTQMRTYETLCGIKKAYTNLDAPVVKTSALNERDYGDYTGKNKSEIEKEVGTEKFCAIRRGWDCPIPNGETLQMVYNRVVPYYKEYILPELVNGKNVLIVSHGNAIRALMKYIEHIPEDMISNVEMPFSQVFVYSLDSDGCNLEKEIIQVDTK